MDSATNVSEMRLRVDKLVENFKKRKHEYEASKDPRVEYRQKRRKIYFEMLEREKLQMDPTEKLRLDEISKSQLTKLSEEFEPKRQELELAELAESYKSFKSFNASEFRLQLTNSREERRKTLSAMKAAVEYSGQITAIRAEFLEKKKQLRPEEDESALNEMLKSRLKQCQKEHEARCRELDETLPQPDEVLKPYRYLPADSSSFKEMSELQRLQLLEEFLQRSEESQNRAKELEHGVLLRKIGFDQDHLVTEFQSFSGPSTSADQID